MVNQVQMQLMDQKFKKFKEFIDDFNKMFSQGYMSFNMWESQHESLRTINEQLKAKNVAAEEALNKTMAANSLVEQEGKDLKAKAQADVQILWAKAHAKFKEFERILEDSDKKRAKESLKQLEALTA